MEHSAEQSLHSPLIKVLPEGFAEPGSRRIRLLGFEGWGLSVIGLISLILFLACTVILVISFLGQVQKNGLSLNDWLMCLGIFVLSLPFGIGPIWYFWFVISRPKFDFSDPLELLRTEGLRGYPDRLTILRYNFFGTDSAIFLDHRNNFIHFFNCHVAKGFIPKVMRVYTCNTDSLRYHERTYRDEDGSVTKGTLTSSDGSTTLVLTIPGVTEFLELVKNPTEGR
jgi:hypothetical protein